MSKPIAQLFIMPFAGGAKAAFKEFESYIDGDIEVVTVEYPGRGSRIREPFCLSMDELILDVKGQIEAARRPDLPFALMGYSMGCEVVFDLAQYILGEQANHLFFCARESIQYDTRGHDYALMDIDRFAERIIALGGIDEKIRNNERFFKIALRPIYADYKLLHDYVFKRDKGLLRQNITIFYSDADTPKEKVADWKEQTLGETDFYEFGDNHFFINQHGEEMAKIISDCLHTI